MSKQERTNTRMALIVEQGITRDLLYGSVVAWKFLSANNVPDALILRVLGDPSQRRGSDLPAAVGAVRALTGMDGAPRIIERPESRND